MHRIGNWLAELSQVVYVLHVRDREASVLDICGGYERLLQSEREALRRSWLFDRVHPADAALLIPDFATLSAQNQLESLFRLRCQDGQFHWIRQNCCLHGTGTAQEYWIAGTLSDGEAQHELLESASRYRDFTKLSSDWYWEQDEQFRFTYFSKEFEEITGISLTGVLGKTRWDGLGKTDYLGVDWEGHKQLLFDHKPFRNFEYPSRIHAERSIWFRVSGHPKFSEDGVFLGYIGIASEIGAYKTIQEELKRVNAEQKNLIIQLNQAQQQILQAEKLAALGTLVVGVAHELNTPIGVSVTVASTLQEQIVTLEKELGRGLRRSILEEFLGDAQAGTEILLRNLDRAARLVSDFKQISTDQTVVQRAVFALDALISECILVMDPSIRASGHQVLPGVLPHIMMDSYPGSLVHVLNNLVDNAFIHAFENGKRGTVRIACQETSDDQIEIVVADDGKGIPKEHLGRIFDPFFTTKLGQGGSGLGLNVAYNLVTGVLGGSISVDSVLGQGARFSIRLPKKAPDRPA